jgi:hypothetical protein
VFDLDRDGVARPEDLVVEERGVADAPPRRDLHLLVQADDLPDEVAAFKSWTARQLIDWLAAHRVTRILDQLAWFKKALVSSGEKRRSMARSSISWSLARQRARGHGGSRRVSATRCICGGRWSSRKINASWMAAVWMR